MEQINYLSTIEHLAVAALVIVVILQSIKLRSVRKQNAHLKMTLTSMLSSIPLNKETAPAVVLGAASLAQSTSENVVMKDNNVVIPTASIPTPKIDPIIVQSSTDEI